MSFVDKCRDKAQVLRGRIKRGAGEATGDRRLEAEGRADEVLGNLKQAGEKVKDAFRGRGNRPRH
ncbi:MAG: CsbD family protein [Pseudonocardiaceae bacterium]